MQYVVYTEKIHLIKETEQFLCVCVFCECVRIWVCVCVCVCACVRGNDEYIGQNFAAWTVFLYRCAAAHLCAINSF
jgi:hypothetical protein